MSVHISELFKNWEVTNSSLFHPDIENEKLNPRQEIIKKFVDRLNEDRKTAKDKDNKPMKLKPLEPSFVASKMYDSQLNTNRALLWFYGYCDEAKNFSSTWWWSLKAQ